MKNRIIFLLVISMLFSSSCVVGYAIAMRDKKIYSKKWKQENYKVKIIGRQGGFGPRYFKCILYEKKTNFYTKIVEFNFLWRQYSKSEDGILYFSEDNYNVKLDLNQFKISFF